MPETEKKPRGRPAVKERTPFGKWLESHPTWTKPDFAKAVGLSLGHIKSLCNGNEPPTLLVALAVAQITNGEFSKDAWGVDFEK